jgi:hypothetical protein
MFHPIVDGITVKNRRNSTTWDRRVPTVDGKGFEMRVVVRKRRKAHDHTREIWHTGSGKRLAAGPC